MVSPPRGLPAAGRALLPPLVCVGV